jgi:hypothetical protein
MNIIIGVFFSETGIELLKYFIDYDSHADDIGRDLAITNDWSSNKFLSAKNMIKNYSYEIDRTKVDYEVLHEFLQEKSSLFLRLMENQNLLEHESFTDLLRAILHLKEEFLSRDDFRALPETDLSHLAGDIKRVYSMLAPQWLDYMRYLKDNYPYLFSLAVRMNPFNKQRSPVVKS